MQITVLHVADCPNLALIRDRLRSASERTGLDVHVQERLIDDLDEARRMGFTGSPTILIDGVDPFASGELMPSLSCRLYATDMGPQGAPTIAALVRVLEP